MVGVPLDTGGTPRYCSEAITIYFRYKFNKIIFFMI